VVLSAVLHGGALALVLLAYRSTAPAPSLADRFVTFLVPPDRTPGQAAGANVTWQETGLEGAGSGGGRAPANDAGSLSTAKGDSTADLVEPAADLSVDSVLTELEVDSIVARYDDSAAPEYPAALLARNIEGSVFVSYVVDTTGRASDGSFRVIRATHPEFARAVRDALPGMRFRPAQLRGVPVPQLVQQSFAFRIRRDSV
jgi:TonB family protein